MYDYIVLNQHGMWLSRCNADQKRVMCSTGSSVTVRSTIRRLREAVEA